MLTTSEALQADIERVTHELAGIDRDIEGRERRLADIRRHRERRYLHLVTLEEQKRRAEAPLVKPTGAAVRETAPDGTVWTV